jgi:pilus assembly protein CpaC
MQVRKLVVLICVLTLMFAVSTLSFAQAAAEAAATTQTVNSPTPNPSAPAPAATPAPAPQQQPGTAAPSAAAPTTEQGPAPLRVMVGKSLLINTTERLKRVSVTDPNVADAIVVTPTQILVHGRAPGEVSLLIWDEAERSRSFDLRVDVDVTAAAEEMHRIFPDEQINVTPSRNAIVLSGHVATEDVAKRAGMIAEAYSKTVVNVLTFGPQGSQEVLLQVKFAEVDRNALTQLGVNILSTGALKTIANTTTQQFGQSSAVQITDAIPVKTVPQPNFPTATTGPAHGAFQDNISVNDLLNVFLFRPDIHLGAVIKALQQRNLLQILAEPNLIAVNGKEASFLAGGEFPFPIVQPGQGFVSVTISFKEFGVRLRFTPVIMPNGNIHLHVAPEVSTLDFSNALTISGFVVPALTTRRAETEFEMQDGQSFVIAGLMDNRVTQLSSKVPGLGDIPILGYLFKSKNFQKNNSELMVLVTARKVSPETMAPPLPKYPQPFLDKQQFDGKPSGGNK